MTGTDLSCFWHHTVEPLTDDSYAVCGECCHVWQTRADWETDVAALAAAIGHDLDPDDRSVCPLCAHDM